MKLTFLLILPLAAAVSCSKPNDSADIGGDYPLTTCPVSGEELGSMGDPVVLDHNGTTVKFCCKSCLPKFNADPEKYLAKLR